MKYFTIFLLSVFLFGCEHLKKHLGIGENADSKIKLRKVVLNVAEMKDSMFIHETVCRGCAYENSTRFVIEDTAGVVALDHINSKDNNSDDVNGGNIDKYLVIVPRKPGSTTIKLYKFWKEPPGASDSANFSQYKIEVRK